MQNGKNISFGLDCINSISLIFNLGFFKLGQLLNFSNSPIINAYSILDFILKMVLNEIVDIDALQNTTNKAIKERKTRIRILYVLVQRFYYNRSLESIAKDIGVNRERVRQIQEKGIRMLKHPKHGLFEDRL